MKKTLPIPLIALGLLILASVFWYHHPTHYSFNDRFIIGNTRDKIIEKYGEPYRADEATITYMIHDDTPELMMGYDNSLWYVIVFQNDAAQEVYLREGYPGG